MAVMLEDRVDRGAIGDIAVVAFHETSNFGLRESRQEVSEVAGRVVGVHAGRNPHVLVRRKLDAVAHVHFGLETSRFFAENLVQPVIMVWRVAQKDPTKVSTGCGEPKSALE